MRAQCQDACACALDMKSRLESSCSVMCWKVQFTAKQGGLCQQLYHLSLPAAALLDICRWQECDQLILPLMQAGEPSTILKLYAGCTSAPAAFVALLPVCWTGDTTSHMSTQCPTTRTFHLREHASSQTFKACCNFVPRLPQVQYSLVEACNCDICQTFGPELPSHLVLGVCIELQK